MKRRRRKYKYDAQSRPRKIQVYVAVTDSHEYFKIGQTGDYIQRLNSLNTTSVPEDYRFIFVFENRALRYEPLEKILHKRFAKKRLRPDREFFLLEPTDLIEMEQIAKQNGYATIVYNPEYGSRFKIVRKIMDKNLFECVGECEEWYDNFLKHLDGFEEHNQRVDFELSRFNNEGEIHSEDYDEPWVGQDAIDRILDNIGGENEAVEIVFNERPELRYKIEYEVGQWYDYDEKNPPITEILPYLTKNQVENPKRYIENSGQYYRIQKHLPSGHYVWGSYRDLETACEVRDYLESCDWPLRLLQKADELGWKRGEYLIMCMRRGVRV